MSYTLVIYNNLFARSDFRASLWSKKDLHIWNNIWPVCGLLSVINVEIIRKWQAFVTVYTGLSQIIPYPHWSCQKDEIRTYLPHVRHVHSFVSVLGRHSDTFVRSYPCAYRYELSRADSVEVARNLRFAKLHFRREWWDRIRHVDIIFSFGFLLFIVDEFTQRLERTVHRATFGSLVLTINATWRIESMLTIVVYPSQWLVFTLENYRGLVTIGKLLLSESFRPELFALTQRKPV